MANKIESNLEGKRIRDIEIPCHGCKTHKNTVEQSRVMTGEIRAESIERITESVDHKILLYCTECDKRTVEDSVDKAQALIAFRLVAVDETSIIINPRVIEWSEAGTDEIEIVEWDKNEA